VTATAARARIAVEPPSALEARPRLFAALEAAYPVAFSRSDRLPPGELNGLIAVGDAGADALARSAPRVPSMLALADERSASTPQRVSLNAHERLAPVLRGAVLSDGHVAPLTTPRHGVTLASVGGAAAWQTATVDGVRADTAAAMPRELGAHEALRDRLYPGRCLALLALAEFCSSVAGELAWRPAAPRAAFVIDDPNLRRPTYGHVHFEELARHASDHRYHVAVAMVPLDGRVVHRGVARLFRAGTSRLSICVHGNEHSGPELGRPQTLAAGTTVAAHALRRVAAFEQRSGGIEVSRVMVPPHERLSEAAAAGLRACGFEAACCTRPYPWRTVTGDHGWLARPDDAGPLTGWRSADIVAGGLPVMLRCALSHPREDLLLRAYLGQAIVVYGHHQDLRDGLDTLADAAEYVNAIPGVRWCSLADLSRTRHETRRAGSTLEVRAFTERLSVDIPAGVSSLRLDTSALAPDCPARTLPITAEGRHEVLVRAVAPASATSPGSPIARSIWPVARRLAGESRDRLAGAIAQPRAKSSNRR
jgi:hypothetical protein